MATYAVVADGMTLARFYDLESAVMFQEQYYGESVAVVVTERG